MLGERENGSSTILITNDLMQQFGITQEQLHSDAMVNAPEIRPSEIHDMTEMMNEMFGSGMLPEVDPADEKLFVATVTHYTWAILPTSARGKCRRICCGEHGSL